MASGCGDVLSLQDLKTAKLHQTFEAEVITGKRGGVATGEYIDYATNPVTGQVQKTMPAILRDIGYKPASFDFTSGGTLSVSDRNTAVLWPIASGGDGDYYYWEGTLPKVIPASSSPSTTGGVSDGAWRPVGDIALRKELADSNAVIKGDALIAVKQPFTGAVARTQHGKNTDFVSVKDFGAVGNGAIDDTAAIQSAIDALQPVGGVLYFPKGYYLISDDLKVNNIPIVVRGDGMMSTQIMQSTSGENGFSFQSNTNSNAPVGGGLLLNTFQIEDISITRSSGTGGSALNLIWSPITSNTPQFIARNFRTYSKADAAAAWQYAVTGVNMNGMRMSTCQLHGNPLEGGNPGAEPFTMKSAIRLVNNTNGDTGLISFFMDKVTALYCNIALEINGWHEGFQLNEVEFVQVGRGIVSNGSTQHQNPDMLITNSHIDARVADIDLYNTFKLKVANCDFIKNDATLNGACIRATASGYASIVGTHFTCIGQQTATNRAIDADLNCFNWTISSCQFLYFNGGAINNQSSGWVVVGNQFDDSPTAVAFFGALGRNVISNNAYRNVANPVVGSGSSNSLIAPIQYAGTVDVIVGTPGALQGAFVTIPNGVFTSIPDIVMFTRIGGNNSLLFSCSYNRATSTATSLKLELTASGSIPAGTYTFGFIALQKLA